MQARVGTSQLAVPVTADDHIIGPADAPVTLVEYADYECPYCGMAERTLRDVRRALADTMRLVFRNFPLVENLAMTRYSRPVRIRCVPALLRDLPPFSPRVPSR